MSGGALGANTVESGLPILGEIPWGIHLCHFYESRGDLFEMLVPYFKAGLEGNQACIWVTDDEVPVGEATGALRAAVPDLETRLKSGQIEIVPTYQWYMKGGRFNAEGVLADWMVKGEEAKSRGFEGARVSGSAFWLQGQHDYQTFSEYEKRLDQAIKGQRIVCLCSYALHRAHAMEVLDVVSAHELALARRRGQWEIIEAAALSAAKEELRRANETLEIQVAERTQEVERLLVSERAAREAAQREGARNAVLFAQAQEAIGLRDEFLSMASHELYTPLHSLQLAVEAVSRRPVAGREDVTHTLEVVARQSKRLVGLVNGLLDASRLATGRVNLHPESLDLAEVVKEMVAQLSQEIARAECPILVRGPDTPVLGEWDRLALEQIVANLLSNATKFGRGKPIHVTVEQVDHTARLVIEDHGIGIPAERLPKIFERFERAVSSRHYGGFGLGLNIVRTVVEAMGGTVHAQSTVGAGSTLVVELPRQPPEKR
jgi:signal transduction histidine kinase